ncbi:gamma-glutamylcyclotransferase [Tumidithrix helvetica]|uniref:gamma-glutamylcyclotransferase n=1 Tax=Tumidithrix helvetica TaxID=3457545 RepID=UPI003CC5F0A2
MTPNQPESTEPMFYYFAYGSCMCPVDLKRSLGENTHPYVVGVARLNGYRLGFYNYSRDRNCGCLDIVKDANSSVEGVLYQLPWRLSDLLDKREGVAQANYRHEMVNLQCQDRWYLNVRTYTVIQKLTEELAPNDWYFNVVLQGAVVCGLSQGYRWQLFEHMYQLQSRQSSTQLQIA